MSLIDATAEENRRVQQRHVVRAGPPVADDRRRIHILIPCIAGLIVVAGLGPSMLISEVSQTPPPVVTADADSALEGSSPVPGNADQADEPAPGLLPLPRTEPDGPAPIDSAASRTQPGVASALEGNSPVPSNAGAADGQAPGSVPAVEPEGLPPLGSAASQTQPPVATAAADSEDGSAALGNAGAPDELEQDAPPATKPDHPIGVEEKRTAEAESATVAAVATDKRPMPTPVAGPQPDERPASGTETRNDGLAANAQASAAAERTTVVEPATSPASEPPTNVRSSPRPADEAGATVEPERTTPILRVAQVVSDVNMRAGPRNSEAVLTSLRKGTPVEVIDCRHWCEVIHDGQRGWIYKRFVEGGSHPVN